MNVVQGKELTPIGQDKKLGFDPLSISYFANGEFMVIAGTNKKLTLWNKDGVRLGDIGELNDWVWSAQVAPEKGKVFAGSNNGHMVTYQVDFNTVHGLYEDRYAYRELMTDVIIQHLVSETRVKIRCRDYIKRIAIYKDKLAVQLPERVIIYSV
jgi:intraflagellar transport protein 122